MARFLAQPIASYRNAVGLAAILAVAGAGASAAALVDPIGLIERFRRLGEPFGHRFMVSEYSVVWRAVAVGYFATLAAAAAFVVVDLRRAAPAALCVGVGSLAVAAALALSVVEGHRFAPSVVAAALAATIGVAFPLATARAARAIEHADVTTLVPRPRSAAR